MKAAPPTASSCAAPILRAGMAPDNKQSTSTSTPTSQRAILPLMPTLAAHCRTTITKSPQTPKLAAATTTKTATPSSRSTPLPARRHGYNNDTPTGTPKLPIKDELVTPVKTFLETNVTPRSSSRKSRAGSTQSTPTVTPNGTPTSSRPATTIGMPVTRDRHQPSIASLPSVTGPARRPKSVVNGVEGQPGLAVKPRIAANFTATASDSGVSNTTFIFPAHDTQSRETSPKMQLQKKTAAFFHANGKRESGMADFARMPSPPLSTTEKDSTKFVYADGTTESKASDGISSPPSNVSSRRSSVVLSPLQQFAPFRSPSPTKDNIHLSYRKGASQVMRPAGGRLQAIPLNKPPANGTIQNRERRRSSLDLPPQRFGHAKSASMSTIDSGSPPRKPLHPPSAGKTLPVSPLGAAKPMLAGIEIPVFSRTLDELQRESVIVSSPTEVLPLSPAKSGSGQNSLSQEMNELAANARRERKVLDLEISNSSLLAINRQLEREVRKQKTELRRFRRLSRAGRFSSGPDRSSNGGESESGGGVAVTGLWDISDDSREEYEDHDVHDVSDEGSVDDDDDDDTGLSPDALADSDARHREKDEKRLRLDLSKHRQLLVDSQKMNQSLKRCLGWTEELIKEGKKALDYEVRVSDVELGGRVLMPEDQAEDGGNNHVDEVGERGGGLLRAWRPPSAPERTDAQEFGPLTVERIEELDEAPSTELVRSGLTGVMSGPSSGFGDTI